MKMPHLSTPVVGQVFSEEQRLHYGERILSLGSCFSERIGSWLFRRGFDAVVNPFGTLYNPVSIAQALECLMQEDYFFTEADLFEYQGKYHSFMHHSRYSCSTKEDTLANITQDLHRGRKYLLEGHWLLITLGSAFLYTHKERGEVVANCHKLPEHLFSHTKGGRDLFVQRLQPLLATLLKRNSALQIILTVSPIRYLRYGAQANQRSKAELILTAEQLEQLFPEKVHYFPAYEIMMDELRDYRFYADDMLHPTDLAVDIIRQRLLEGWLASSEWEPLSWAQKLFQRVQHRMDRASKEELTSHNDFLRAEGERIRDKFPNLVLENILSLCEDNRA